MDDIIKRLRQSADDCDAEDRLDLTLQAKIEREAAITIERLRRQVSHLSKLVRKREYLDR
jgi:uncharacterized protein YabE (DUF348 family)